MRCELSRDYRFEAAHRLPKVPESHRCYRMHGHSYRIEVTCAGDVDPALGWLMDFADMDVHIQPLIEQLDHRLLNDIDGLDNPTSEILAAWMWQRLHGKLAHLAAIAVSETPDSRCTYRGQ